MTPTRHPNAETCKGSPPHGEGRKNRDLPPELSEERDEFLRLWHDAYVAHFGRKYALHKRDTRSGFDLVTWAAPEEIVEVATRAWSCLKDKFLAKAASTIHGLADQWNEINNALRGGSPALTIKPGTGLDDPIFDRD